MKIYPSRSRLIYINHKKGFNKGAFMEAGQIKKVESLLYDSILSGKYQIGEIELKYCWRKLKYTN